MIDPQVPGLWVNNIIVIDGGSSSGYSPKCEGYWMGLSTLYEDSFARQYRRFHRKYLRLDLMQLQELRCRLSTAVQGAMQRYNYNVKFWASYYAADDAYYQNFAKPVGFKGTLDPCTWPSRGEGVRVLSRSGKIIYASVDTGETVHTPFKRRRKPEGDLGPRVRPDS